KAKEQLRRSEERYHLMVNQVEDYAIVFLDMNGIIKSWNKGAEKIKGYKAEDINGENFSIFYTKEDRELKLPEKFLEEAARNGKAEREGWRVKKDGTLFWASVVITALYDEHKNIIGYTKVTRDLSERKKIEDQLKKFNEDLEEQVKI